MNKPGVDGMIGTEAVVKAIADGAAIGLDTSSSLVSRQPPVGARVAGKLLAADAAGGGHAGLASRARPTISRTSTLRSGLAATRAMASRAALR